MIPCAGCMLRVLNSRAQKNNITLPSDIKCHSAAPNSWWASKLSELSIWIVQCISSCEPKVKPKMRWFSTTKMALTFDPCPFPFVSLCPIFKYQTESHHLYSCLHVIPIYPANFGYITPFCFLKTQHFWPSSSRKVSARRLIAPIVRSLWTAQQLHLAVTMQQIQGRTLSSSTL